MESQSRVNPYTSQGDGPVIMIHDILEHVSFDEVKKYMRKNITGACIRAVIFVPEFKGKQLYVLGPDKDLKDAKRANADPKTSEQCLGLAVFVDSGT